jgi:arginyl-tRNA synthetase
MSSPLAVFRQALASAIAQSQGLSTEALPELERQLRVPEAGRGDLSFPCFNLAKQLQRSPADLAGQLAEVLAGDPRWSRVEAAGPYVNVGFATRLLAETVVPLARAPGFGGGEEGRGKTVVIDFSSPNIAKPLAFHHIRSTVIGAALGRLHAARGWRVVGINYLGDWGKQFGLLASGFLRYGDPARRADAKHLVEVYVRANKEADVAGTRAAIALPEQAQKLAQELEAARSARAAGGLDAAREKELARTEKGLEKKLRAMRGIDDEAADPLTGFDGWLAEARATAVARAAALPEVEARDQEARLFLKRMEDKDPAALAEWREFRDTSIREFEKVYARMGIEFTGGIGGESVYQDALESTVARVRERPGTRIDQGAEIVALEAKKGEPPAMLKTRDGTTLYLTRDVAAAIDRFERFAFDRSLYVVAQDQALHFDQLFRVLGAMGFSWADRMRHVAFGRVHGMSTRRGAVIFLDEVLEESTQKARAISEQSEKIAPEHLDEAVEAIGVGAVVFGDLKNLRQSDYTFSWEQVLDFNGHTAPYVQFSHARCSSILRRAGGVPASADLSRLTLDEERAVLLALGAFPDAVLEATEGFEPSLVTRALLDLAQVTAAYLTAGNRDRAMRVLVEDDAELRAARLWLVDAVRNTLRAGLALLGVRAPEAM